MEKEKMAESICKKVQYINQVCRNLVAIKEEQLRQLLESIRQSNLLFLVAQGRSESALRMGLRGIQREILSLDDTNFRWRNFPEAAPYLQRRFPKIDQIINSGSGGTTTPKEIARETKEYIDRTHNQYITICAVTSNLDSEVAKNSQIIVQLRGREETDISLDKLQSGIMGDCFELGSLMLYQKIKEVINQNRSFEELLLDIQEEMKALGALIDEYLESPEYSALVEEISSRPRTIAGGLGPGREVANMTAIRLRHIREIFGGKVYRAGPFTPNAMPGDVLLLISFSGETKSVLEWCRLYKKAGGKVFSIVGNESSTLARESTSYHIKSPVDQFYTRATFLLSPVAGGVMEFFTSRGLKVPESVIENLSHSRTQ